MTAYESAALRATPLCFFLFQKQFDRVVAHSFQILYHAQPVLRSVPLIQCLQPLAWEAFTFKAEADRCLRKLLTLITHMGAVFSSRNTARAVFSVKTLRIQVVSHRLITNAQVAVHATRSNHLLFHNAPTI
jgi:hypothetical protein